jgi:hypothetical protein
MDSEAITKCCQAVGMTLNDAERLLESLVGDDSFPTDIDDALQFLIRRCQDMNVLSRDPTTNYLDIMKRAATPRYDLRQTTGLPSKKAAKKEKERDKGSKLPDTEAPSTSHPPDSPPPRKRRPTGDILSTEVLECLQTISQKLDTTNMLLGQLINNFQSWRQLDLPRGPTAVSMAPPAPPSIQSSATSVGQESVTLLTPMVLD